MSYSCTIMYLKSIIEVGGGGGGGGGGGVTASNSTRQQDRHEANEDTEN